MILMKRLWFLIFFSIMSRLLCGNVYFKHLGKSDGLSQISVVSICQDELGRMWFGTLEGLSCYDGNGMTVYKPSLVRENSFLGNEVHNLVSAQGNVFFTSDRTLVRYDVRQETFHDLQLKASCLYSDGHNVWRLFAIVSFVGILWKIVSHSYIACLSVILLQTFIQIRQAAFG